MSFIDFVHDLVPWSGLARLRLIIHDSENTLRRRFRVLNSLILRRGCREVHHQKNLQHICLWIFDSLSDFTKTLLSQIHLLCLEYRGDVELVKLLIDIIDAKLLEIIQLEVLEAENVKQANRFSNLVKACIRQFRWLNCFVHLYDKPIEHIIVELLGQSISIHITGGQSQVLWNPRTADFVLLYKQNFLEFIRVLITKQLSHENGYFPVLDLTRSCWCIFIIERTFVELDFAHMKDGSAASPDSLLLLGRKVHFLHRFENFLKLFLCVFFARCTRFQISEISPSLILEAELL